MNITIRNIPDEIVEKLRTLSKISRRSLNNEILVSIERGLSKEPPGSSNLRKNISRGTQIEIWEKLAGTWQDKRSTRKIIEEIYTNRTPGREVDL
ncbi:Arc family DNA-binding protein [bacterium]|nr:Arc family DNA-binding protein [bacterium]